MTDLNKALRIAATVVAVSLIVYFGLAAIRRGAPQVGAAAGEIQDTVK